MGGGGRALGSISAVVAVAIGGCGNSRTPAPSVTTPAAPSAFRTLRFPALGFRIQAPQNWSLGEGKSPLVTTVSSGPAVVAVWRYPRQSAPPSSRGGLLAAQRGLIAQARTRDPRLTVIRTKRTRIDGAPAVELDAFERVAGVPRRVRSLHVFQKRAELVLEEYAPADVFHSVDHLVFSPIKRSLVLSAAGA